jgi:hypothetical protein
VQQFFTAAAKDPGMIKGSWIYMIESDYVFMKPLPIPSEESQVGPWVGGWVGVLLCGLLLRQRSRRIVQPYW